MNTQQVEKYSFEHIMTLKMWQSLNDETVYNAVRCVKNMRLIDLFKEEVQSALYELEGKNNEKEFRVWSRQDKREYRTYKKILQDCIIDSSNEGDDYNLDGTDYNLLDLWEETDKVYRQTCVMHFYYLCITLSTVDECYCSYKSYKYKLNKRNDNRKPGTKKEKLVSFPMYYNKYMKDQE